MVNRTQRLFINDCLLLLSSQIGYQSLSHLLVQLLTICRRNLRHVCAKKKKSYLKWYKAAMSVSFQGVMCNIEEKLLASVEKGKNVLEAMYVCVGVMDITKIRYVGIIACYTDWVGCLVCRQPQWAQWFVILSLRSWSTGLVPLLRWWLLHFIETDESVRAVA